MEAQPARVGWTDTYRQLRSDRSLSSTDRDLLTLRAGQAPPGPLPTNERPSPCSKA